MTNKAPNFREKLAQLGEQELQDLKDAYPSAGAGPQDNLADAVEQRLAELKTMSF